MGGPMLVSVGSQGKKVWQRMHVPRSGLAFEGISGNHLK